MSTAPLPMPSKPNGATMVIVGLALAVLAVILVNVYANVLLDKNREKTFVAYQFVAPGPAGRPLHPKMVAEVQIPVRFAKSLGKLVPQDAIAGQTDGKTLLAYAASPGDLLTYNFFVGHKDAKSQQDNITAGYLAVAIKVDNPPASLEPGSYVDLQVQVPAGNGRPGVRMVGLMEQVYVIAKGEAVVAENNAIPKGGMGALKIDIKLTPEQAMQIKNIQRAMGGTPFEVTVRSPFDSSSHGTVPDITQVNPEVFRLLNISPYQANR